MSAIERRHPAHALVARIELSYDGTDFHGWQVQPGGLRTVQGVLVDALRHLVPLRGLPPGAGRTDAGVHARGQVCSVPLGSREQFGRVARSLPRMMPPDIAIRSVEEAPADFHARFGATARRYAYRFTLEHDPIERRNQLLIHKRTDLEAMAAACAPLVGNHDASSLCRTPSLEPGRTRSVIREATLTRSGSTACFVIEADRFLHSMVRIVVGTLLEVGAGKRPVDTFRDVLAARDRSVAGATAPPHGLTLERVRYDRPASPATEG